MTEGQDGVRDMGQDGVRDMTEGRFVTSTLEARIREIQDQIQDLARVVKTHRDQYVKRAERDYPLLSGYLKTVYHDEVRKELRDAVEALARACAWTGSDKLELNLVTLEEVDDGG